MICGLIWAFERCGASPSSRCVQMFAKRAKIAPKTSWHRDFIYWVKKRNRPQIWPFMAKPEGDVTYI